MAILSSVAHDKCITHEIVSVHGEGQGYVVWSDEVAIMARMLSVEMLRTRNVLIFRSRLLLVF